MEVQNCRTAENIVGTIDAGLLPAVERSFLASPLQAVLPQEFNAQLHGEAERGQPNLYLRLDRATRHGQDAETLEAADIRRGGVSLSTLADAHQAFTGMRPSQRGLVMDAGAEGAPLLGLFAALLAANGQVTDTLHGMIGADPLGVLAQEGTLPMDLPALYYEMAQTVRWAEAYMPEMRTILVDVSRYSAAGASAVQEVGYAMATGLEYIKALCSCGISVDVICRHIGFCFSREIDSRLDTAKIQAAVRIWESLTAFCPDAVPNGSMRIYEAALPSSENMPGIERWGNEKQRREDSYALCHVGRFLDDAASEDELRRIFCQQAQEVLHYVQANGGMAEVLTKGLVQVRLAASLQWQLDRLAQRFNALGNVLPTSTVEPSPIDTERIRTKRLQAIQRYRREMDEQQRLAELSGIALHRENASAYLIDSIRDAFLAGATLAEIIIPLHAGQLELYIEHPMACHVVLAEFFQLRQRTASFGRQYGARPQVFLCNVGTADEYGAAATWSIDVFESAGFQITANQEFFTAESAVNAALAAGARIIVICSNEERDSRLVPAIARGIKAASADIIVLTVNLTLLAMEKNSCNDHADGILGSYMSGLDLSFLLDYLEDTADAKTGIFGRLEAR